MTFNFDHIWYIQLPEQSFWIIFTSRLSSSTSSNQHSENVRSSWNSVTIALKLRLCDMQWLPLQITVVVPLEDAAVLVMLYSSILHRKSRTSSRFTFLQLILQISAEFPLSRLRQCEHELVFPHSSLLHIGITCRLKMLTLDWITFNRIRWLTLQFWLQWKLQFCYPRL